MATFKTNEVQTAGLRVVDVSDKPIEAEVVRNGYKVPSVALNENLIADFVADDKLDGIKVQQRVAYQSVPAGKRVARGTVVDVVLSSPYLMDAGLIVGAHQGLRETSIGTVGETYFADQKVRDEVRKAQSADDLSAGARASLEAIAEEQGLELINEDPTRDFGAFYTVIKAADAYS